MHVRNFKLHIVDLQYCGVCVSTKFVDLMFICAAHAGINNFYMEYEWILCIVLACAVVFYIHFVENQLLNHF